MAFDIQNCSLSLRQQAMQRSDVQQASNAGTFVSVGAHATAPQETLSISAIKAQSRHDCQKSVTVSEDSCGTY